MQTFGQQTKLLFVFLLSMGSMQFIERKSLREKCHCVVRIFPHSDWIRRDTEYLFVFSPNIWSVFSRIRTEYEEMWSISFPAFGLNTERYGVSLRIQSEYGKIRTRKNSVFGYFSRSEIFGDLNDEKLKIKNCMKQKNIGNNCSTWIL